jgi:hypothetical protein
MTSSLLFFLTFLQSLLFSLFDPLKVFYFPLLYIVHISLANSKKLPQLFFQVFKNFNTFTFSLRVSPFQFPGNLATAKVIF